MATQALCMCREQLAKVILDSSLLSLLSQAFDKLLKAVEDVSWQLLISLPEQCVSWTTTYALPG